MSDWWIRKIEPAAAALEASVSSAASSSPSAAAAATATAATVDAAASNADDASIEAVEASVSLPARLPAVPLSPTASEEDVAMALAAPDDEEAAADKDEQQQQQRQGEDDDEDEDEEDDRAAEDESEHEVLTLDDVIAPSTSSPLSPSAVPASASPNQPSAGMRSAASLLAELDLAQLSPRKADASTNTNRLSLSPTQPPSQLQIAARGAAIGSSLDDFLNQHTAAAATQPLDDSGSQQTRKHNNSNNNKTGPVQQRHTEAADDSRPSAVRRPAAAAAAAAGSRAAGNIRQSPAARRSFAQSLGLSIQAAIQGLHTDDGQKQAKVERKEQHDDDEEDDDGQEADEEGDQEVADDTEEDEEDDDNSPASASASERDRGRSEPFRSSLMRIRRVSRRDRKHVKDNDETKESTLQQQHDDSMQRKQRGEGEEAVEEREEEDEEEDEGGETDKEPSEQQPALAASESMDDSGRATLATSLAAASGTHDGLPTFHFHDSHNEHDDEQGDDGRGSGQQTAAAATAAPIDDRATERSDQRTLGRKEPDRDSASEGSVDEQQPGAPTAQSQLHAASDRAEPTEQRLQRAAQTKREEEEEEERGREQRRKEEADKEAETRRREEQEREEAERQRERDELQRAAERRRKGEEEEKAKSTKAAEERDRAAAAAALAAAVVAESAAPATGQAARAPVRSVTSSPSVATSKPANVGVWKSSRRSAMLLLVTELTNAAFLQPTHGTQQPHLPARVAHILQQAIIHWELLPAATAASAPSSVSALSASSFRSAFTASSLSVNQTSFRFLPSAARAKSVDSSVAVFPHPLPAFSSLSAAPHFTLPPAAPQDDSPQHNSEPIEQLTPLDRAVVLAALLYALHSSVHSAAREDDTPHICALFTVIAQLRSLVMRHSNTALTAASNQSQTAAGRLPPSSLTKAPSAYAATAGSSSSLSPVLDRVYALPFMSNSPLVPSAPPTFDSFLPPPFTSLGVLQWLNVQLLELQALCHQLVVQAVMSAWQTSLPALSDVWLEEDGGAARTDVLSSYCSSYQQFDGMCQLADWSVSQRQSVLSCCLHWIVSELFNSALALPNLNLDTGLRVKQFCSTLSDLARRLVGDGFGSSMAVMLTPLQELAMFLLMDKTHTTLDEMRMLTPSMPLLALHHLLFVFMQSEGNGADEEDSVSPQLLQQIATNLAAEQHSGQAADKQESATKSTHIVLMLDFANQLPTALPDGATNELLWQWPDALLLSRELAFVTQTQGESAIH